MSTVLRADGTTVTERLAYTYREAEQALPVTRQTLHAMVVRGELRVAKIGRKVVIPRSEMLRLAGELPEVSP